MWVLLAIAAVNTVVAAFYYLNIVRYMFFVPAEEDAGRVNVSPAFGVTLGITAVVTVLLGLAPGPLIAWASQSASALAGHLAIDRTKVRNRMRLAQLIEGLPGVVSASGNLAVEVSAITSDSRQVTPGLLFVAYQGVGVDGRRYLADALARGASAVVVERAQPDIDVPTVTVTDGRAALAWLHAAWFGHPSRAFTVVGVTGTDGKTTTCNLLFSILKASGTSAGMISTVNAVIGDDAFDTGLHTTTPDAADVQRYPGANA